MEWGEFVSAALKSSTGMAVYPVIVEENNHRYKSAIDDRITSGSRRENTEKPNVRIGHGEAT